MKLKEFSDIAGGEIIGDPETEITGVAGIKDAKRGDITYLAAERYLPYLRETLASCVIVKKNLEGMTIAQLRVENPHFSYCGAGEECPCRTLRLHRRRRFYRGGIGNSPGRLYRKRNEDRT
jgi:UDP-3-O-[3-hydroxymyristoyl] glucosamine N-acyltransferase